MILNGIGLVVIWRLFKALFYNTVPLGERYQLSVLHRWNFGACK